MRIALFYIVFLGLASCTSIDNLEPAQSNVFLKFYSETNEMDSRDLAVLDDGYLVLSIYNDTTSLLLKTDSKGNKLWAESLVNFRGNSLAVVSDGYIIIGDGINKQAGDTFMKLIKTNKSDGSIISTTQTGDGFQHGTAVVLSGSGIIASGYASAPNNDSIIIAEYDINLENKLSQRFYKHSTPSKSIYESNGLLSWLSYSNQTKGVNITEALIDNESPKWDNRLFNTSNTADFDGDIAPINTGYSIVQTISGTETKIAIAFYNNGAVSDETIINTGEFAIGNYTASSIINAENGLLILATTDVHTLPGEGARKDLDILLFEVNYDGSIKENGINQIFGGLGDEIPMRIRKTKDGGYAIIGTLINTKGAQQTFLLKTNKKGQLD